MTEPAAAFEEVLRKEREHLSLEDAAPASALCLSGGGIRSATFALGVLQGLAREKKLAQFHYLSTVSGGGYIGSWLTRWIAEVKAERGEGKQEAPPGDEIEEVQKRLGATAGQEPDALRNLRSYSNYLSPVWGMSTDFFTLVSIFLRNLILNWSILVPLLLLLAVAPHLYLGLATAGPDAKAAASWLPVLPAIGLHVPANWLIALALLGFLVAVAYVVADLPGTALAKRRPQDQFPTCCFAPVLCAAMLLGLAVQWPGSILRDETTSWLAVGTAGAVVHVASCVLGTGWRSARGLPALPAGQRLNSLLDFLFVIASGFLAGLLIHWVALWDVPRNNPRLYTLVAVPAFLFAFWLATTAYVALARLVSSENDREWWARSGAWWLRAALAWLAGCLLVLWAPEWLTQILGLKAESLAAAGGIGGVAVSVLGYITKNGRGLATRAQSFAQRVGARLLDLAAIAFIIVLFVGLSLLVNWASPAADVRWFGGTPIEKKDVLTARELESAAREAEAFARLSEAADDGPESLRAAQAAARSVRKLGEATLASPGDEAEFVRVLEATAKAAGALSKSAAAQGSDTQAAELLRQARTRVTDAAAGLALQRESPAAPPTILGVPQGPTDAAGRIAVTGLLSALLAVVTFATAYFVGVNTFSLHGMYGNRLVRAYLGAPRRQARRQHWFTGFDEEDNIRMHEVQPRRLFHVVNLALNLVRPSGKRLEWQQRKAASFTVSPLHSGAPILGYRKSEHYSSRQGISLGRAMTISGAAAAPNMGYHSSAPVAFVMTLFNARLGWWLPNPAAAGRKVWSKSEPTSSLQPLVWEACGLTDETRPYVYLSDGGHFDNLGLYEMVRRRCRRILVVDSSADPSYAYDDLQATLRKIRVDLGVDIELPEGAPHRSMRYTVGRIAYHASGLGDDGVLLYLKPVLRGDEPLDVRHYAALSRARDGASVFPHQTTADQFFDESQFESYRMLGLYTALAVMKEIQDKEIGDGEGWPRYKEFADRVMAAASTQEGSEAKRRRETPSDDAGRLLGTVPGALQSFGQGALVATALSVGGVLGVTGTVALKDSSVSLRPGAEVAISEESLANLKSTRLQASVSPRSLKLEGEGVLRELSRSLRELKTFADRQENNTQAVRDLRATVERVETRLTKLPWGGVPPPADLTAIGSEIRKVVAAVDGLSASLDKGIAPALSRLRDIDGKLSDIDGKFSVIEGKLRNIHEELQAIPARRNVRGIEAGQR
jgi:hypothetical protein